MKIYVEKLNRYGYRYIASWINSDNYIFHDYHKTLKELKAYFSSWDNTEFIYTWKGEKKA